MDLNKIANILALILVLVYVTWNFTATSAVSQSEGSNTQDTVSIMEDTKHFSTERTQEEMHKLIKSLATNNGWDITEFKSNTLIAEKVENDNSISLSILFDNSSYSLSVENKELNTILDNGLK